MGIQDALGFHAQYKIPVILQLRIIVIPIQIFIRLQITYKAVSTVQYDTDAVFTMAWRTPSRPTATAESPAV